MSEPSEKPEENEEAHMLAEQYARAALAHGEMPLDIDAFEEFFAAIPTEDFFYWWEELRRGPHGAVETLAESMKMDFSVQSSPPNSMDTRTLDEFQRWIEGGSKGKPPNSILRWIRREIFQDLSDESGTTDWSAAD